ncbi:MAG: phosphotransferase [Phycisphaerales bacterium]|nr:phosphotransferase [Phycisphaerales bacterium]NNM24979.1 phosphotransferase [Phycisphaerales bacterium]
MNRRTARLREAARRALTQYDLAVRQVRLRLDVWNCLFRVDAADGARYVLRLTARRGCHGVDETWAEIAWVDALQRETTLAVRRPVAMRDGSFVGVLDDDLAPDHHQHVLFEWRPGRTPGARLGVRTAFRLGRFAASLHEHARTFTLASGRARRFDHVFPYADTTFADREPILLFDERFAHLLTRELRAAYERGRHAAQAVIDELFAGTQPPRLIHNDLHPWNILLHDGGLVALDFEDLMWGYPIQDIATTFYYLRIRDNGESLETAYRRGYETIAPWPVAQPETLTSLVAGRGLILANGVLAAPDAAERDTASHYLPLIGARIARWLPRRTPDGSCRSYCL